MSGRARGPGRLEAGSGQQACLGIGPARRSASGNGRWSTFSPDGKALRRRPAQRVDPPLGPERASELVERATFPAHEGPVTGVLAVPPGRHGRCSPAAAITWSGPGTSRPTRRGEKIKPQGPIGGLGGIAFSPDGTKLAVSDAEFVRLWDLSDAREPLAAPDGVVH